MYYLTDRVEVVDLSELKDGRIVVDARVARGGNVQLYRGDEMGVPDKPVLRVYRPNDEVFDTESMSTFPHKFITLNHPKGKAQFDQHAVGWIGDEVARDGDFIRVPMTIAHRKALDAIRSGKRELSVGYETEIEFESGVTPSGEQYDAKMLNIVVDHVAIVDQARGGSELRIGDWLSADASAFSGEPYMEESNMSDVKLTTITVDGLSVQTTEPGAQAISKLTKDLEGAQTALQDAQTAHTDALAAKDRELATKDAKIEELQGKILSDADLDKRVNDRADLIATAKVIADKDYTGMSDADIRKSAVTAVVGSDAIDGKSDDYVQARFDILADEAAQDGVRKVMKSGTKRTGDAVGKAHDGMVSHLQNAWKGEEVA